MRNEGQEEKENRNTDTFNHGTSTRARMTVTFPDSSNLKTVARVKMMSPGSGRFNTDSDAGCRPTEIDTLSMPDGHCNQADCKGIEALWIPRRVVLSCAIESSTGTRSKVVNRTESSVRCPFSPTFLSLDISFFSSPFSLGSPLG